MRPGATPATVASTAIEVARDGTRAAIVAVAEAAGGLDDWRAALPVLRAAVEPFDTVGPHYRQPALDARLPSRTKAIEELPIAIGMLLVAGGDYREAVLGSVNYGRDSDSIASMAGALAGALGGRSSLPADWQDAVSSASRVDLAAPGATMAAVTREIWERDAARAEAVASARTSYR